MAKTDKEIAYALKEIIDKNGPEYLTDAPFQVFKELIASAGIDRKTAGAILHFLVSSLPGDVSSDSDFESLSGTIRKECSFNKKNGRPNRVDFFCPCIHRIIKKNGKRKTGKDFHSF